MKSILLASASVFAFAGAAAAEGHSGVSFGGEATLGYNDVLEDGFFYDANLGVTFSAALDNGLTASATVDFDVTDNNDGNEGLDLNAANYLLTLESDMASLRFGEVDPAAEGMWDGVDGSEVADFNDYDTHVDVAGFEAVMRGDVMLGSLLGGGSDAALAVSFGADVDSAGNDLTGEQIDALQVAATGTFGAFGLMAAFQQEFGPTPQIIAVAGTASFFGADLKVAYEDDGTENSIGGIVAYPIGPITVGGYVNPEQPGRQRVWRQCGLHVRPDQGRSASPTMSIPVTLMKTGEGNLGRCVLCGRQRHHRPGRWRAEPARRHHHVLRCRHL